MKTEKPTLSVIIPVYNESKRLHNIEKIASYLKKQSFTSEILIVDDGSTDTTKQLLQKFAKTLHFQCISYNRNMGKGYAIKTGMLKAKGTYRLFIDVDLATPIEDYAKCIPYEKEYQVIIASRRINGSKILIHQPKLRELMGKFFTLLSQIILGMRIRDFTCGFKCFHENAAKEIFSLATINRWGFDSEILFIAKKLGYAIKEIPVTWKNDTRTRVKFPQDIITSLLELLQIRFNVVVGKYNLAE